MGVIRYKNWFFAIAVLGSFFVAARVSAEEPALTQREVADSVKPGVVKIVQHVRGNVVIPAIDIDFKAMAVTAKTDVPPQNIQIDEYLTGSGIIVTPDGYIMTNSHIVSYQTIKNLIVSDFIYRAIDDGYVKLSEEEAKSISEKVGPEGLGAFGEKIADYILQISEFDLAKTVSVLNPASIKETLEGLTGEGFTANIVSVNDNFFKDNQDAALIKIDQQDLPAVPLGDSSDVFTGKRVYILGYPSTAEINDRDLLDPTFSQGTINATKDSPENDFKIFQTDAKISKGSSGGPLLDEQGKVIGLITFITSDLTKQDGDSFAFAIPINVVRDVIGRNKVAGDLPVYQTSNYNESFLRGINLLKGKRCQKAVKEFDLAKQANASFVFPSGIDPYIKQCEGIISSGESIDSLWDSVKSMLKGSRLYWVIGSMVLVITLVTAWYWLFRRMRRDEEEMDNIEESMHLDLNSGLPVEKEDDYAVNDLPDNLKPKIHQ